VFLERAAWVNADGNLEEIQGPGILLTEKNGIRSVMFLDASTEHPSPNSTTGQTPSSSNAAARNETLRR
jgi:hypothetical protein